MERIRHLVSDWTLASAAYTLALIIMVGVAAKQAFGQLLQVIWP